MDALLKFLWFSSILNMRIRLTQPEATLDCTVCLRFQYFTDRNCVFPINQTTTKKPLTLHASGLNVEQWRAETRSDAKQLLRALMCRLCCKSNHQSDQNQIMLRLHEKWPPATESEEEKRWDEPLFTNGGVDMT